MTRVLNLVIVILGVIGFFKSIKGNGDGRTGNISGFVTLDEEDCTNIYKAMI